MSLGMIQVAIFVPELHALREQTILIMTELLYSPTIFQRYCLKLAVQETTTTHRFSDGIPHQELPE